MSGRVKLALTIVAAFSGSPALAIDSYRCNFVRECIDDAPCRPIAIDGVFMNPSAEGWSLDMVDGQTIGFADLPGTPDGTIRIVSDEIDPDADAAAMLSVARDGRAILSIHGYFPDLGVVTHLGTCLPEDG